MPCQCHPMYSPERHPGGDREKPRQKIKHGTQGDQVNSHLRFLVSTVDISKLNNAKDSENVATSETQGLNSRTELNSHENMPVVGQNCYILSDSNNFAEVNAFSPDYDTKNIPIVDTAVQYGCPHSMMTYILVIWNALHVTSTKIGLIPPFMMQ